MKKPPTARSEALCESKLYEGIETHEQEYNKSEKIVAS